MENNRSRREFLAGMGTSFVGLYGLSGCRLDGDAGAQQAAPTNRRVLGGAIRRRKDINSLTAEEIKTYADAIAAMRKLPASNPHSLAAQAKIHGDHCAHSTWTFLPWHRPYLSYFEETVRKVSGKEDFALPYWDWSASATIPRALADTSSPLYDSTRQFQGLIAEEISAQAISAHLGITLWEDFMGSATAMGGIEGSPHASIHVAVGGNMSAFSTTGLDPLFWLHHCNIDRLWQSWMAANNIGAHPDAAQNTAWTNSTLSRFWDRDQAAAQVLTGTTLDTRNYAYEYDSLYVASATSRAQASAPRVLAFNSIPRNRIFNASPRSDGIASFPLPTDVALQVASLGNGNMGMGLVGSQTGSSSSTGSTAPLRTISLVVEGHFSNGSKLVVKSGTGGARLASLCVFAHHANKIHLSLLGNAARLAVRNGTLDIAVEVNGRNASDAKVQLVVV